MNFFLHRFKNGWTTLKFVRVGVGGLILYSSIESGQVVGIKAGGIFTIIFLLSDGVCYVGGYCSYIPNKNNSSRSKTIEYEELDTK